MTNDEFERVVEHSFERLPEKFKNAIENLGVIVEDFPGDDIVRSMKLPSKYHLLGLYQGVPLSARGSWYGMTPVLPDKITLYKKNIESVSGSENKVEDKIVEVLLHEIGHYFGMNEEEIRAAGY